MNDQAELLTKWNEMGTDEPGMSNTADTQKHIDVSHCYCSNAEDVCANMSNSVMIFEIVF